MLPAGIVDDQGRLNTADMRTIVLAAIIRADGQNALARELGIPQGEIGPIVTGLRPVGSRLARALGFTRHAERTITYRAIPSPAAHETDGA